MTAQFLERGHGGIFPDVLKQVESEDLAVLSGVGQARIDGRLDVRQLDLTAMHLYSAADVAAIGPPEDAHGHLGAACTHESRQSDDLTLVNHQIGMIDHGAGGILRVVDSPIADLEHLLADVWHMLGIEVGQLTADHLLDKQILIQRVIRVDSHTAHRGTIAQNGYPIRNLSHLAQLVGDEDAGHSLLVTQLPNQVQQMIGIIVVQSSCGLIQNK